MLLLTLLMLLLTLPVLLLTLLVLLLTFLVWLRELYSCYSANWNSASTSLSFLRLSAVVLQRVRSARNVSPAHIPHAPAHTPCAPAHTTCAPRHAPCAPHLPRVAQGTVQLLLNKLE